MNFQQQAQFFNQLAALLDSGLSVQQTLALSGRGFGSAFQSYLQKVSAAVGMGQNLATAMSVSPGYFDQWTIGLIEVAEYSGLLPQACRKLAIAASRTHRQQRLYNRVKLAAIATIWSLFLLAAALMAGSTTVMAQPHFWLLAIGLLAVLWIGFSFLGSSPLSPQLQQLVQGVPILGKILQARAMLDFAQLELPLSCGISLVTALELLHQHIPDPVMARKIAIAIQGAIAGQPLSKTLQGQLPPLALQMIRTGEETGNLDAAWQKLATYYEQELERLLHQLNSILLPLSTIAIGALVALVGIWGITFLINSLPG
jgi:type II secretory pathway component PulF